MTRSILVSLTLLVCFSAQAQKKNSKKTSAPPAPALSLREMAIQESTLVNQQVRPSATDAQVTAGGMLTLKDPKPEAIGRSWSYFAALTAQSFQAEGVARKESNNTFNLGDRNATVMPGLEIGVLTPAMRTDEILWKLGARGKGGFASQGGGVVLSSGYKVDDARLNTSLLSIGPVVTASWERYSWFTFTFTPQFGNVSYTQTSSNDYAKFSKQAGYMAYGYGLDFQVGKQWSVFTEYSNRELKGDNDIALQKDNFELGTKVTW